MRLWIRSSSRTAPGGTPSSCSCSLAHGLSRARADSDLDLAVLLEGAPAGLTDHSAFIGDLQALSPDRGVDVALVNRADPLFRRKITEKCPLLYGSPRPVPGGVLSRARHLVASQLRALGTFRPRSI